MRGNTLVWRFCAYGFLKNIKFFKPYLITVLLSWGMSLSQIGFLVSVEKTTTWVLEFPSGYLADRCGLRRTLCSCFVAYIASFVLYFYGHTHVLFCVAAAMCYGTGEALRTGVHKAMVYLWLERHDLLSLKSMLGGRTRSFSLLGSAVSALVSIAIVFKLDNAGVAPEYIFLCSVLPYILDLCLVASYPAYMDATSHKKKAEMKLDDGSQRWCLQWRSDARAILTLMRDPERRRTLLSAAWMECVHRLVKDLIQPVVLVYGPSMMMALWSAEENGGLDAPATMTKRTQAAALGLMYCAFNLVSAPATRQAYRLVNYYEQRAAAEQAAAEEGTSCVDDLEAMADTVGEMDAAEVPPSNPSNAAGVAAANNVAMASLHRAYAMLLLLGGAVLQVPVLSWVVLPCYCLLYVAYNLFKPIGSGAIADLAGKDLRATVLSTQSLLRALGVSVAAPLTGLVADSVSVSAAIMVVSVTSIIISRQLS